MSKRLESVIYLIIPVLGLPCLGPSQVKAQCELTKVFASNGGPVAGFGSAVSVSGDVLVVADANQNVYIYRPTFGVSMSEQQLPDPPAAPLTTSIDVDNGRIAAAVTGRVYLYHYDGSNWFIAHEVTSADQHFMQNFLRPVPMLHDDTLVLGAPYADDLCPSDPNCDSGAAYVFHWNGSSWIEAQKLTASNAEPQKRFGYKSVIDGNRMLIHAIRGNGATGSVYVFEWDGAQWVERTELVPSDGQFGWGFGTSIALDGDRAVVGAPQDLGCATSQDPCTPGAAYVYDWNGSTWGQTQILTPSDGFDGDRFGAAVASEGDIIAVGAYGSHFFSTQDTGALYVFRQVSGVWEEQTRITASDGGSGHQFGRALALQNGIAYVGSRYADSVEPISGAVYMFGIDGDCDDNAQIDTCEILNDPSLDLNGNLQLDLCDHFIPTVSTWGVATMALVMLTAGSMIVQRRRLTV